MQIFGQLLFVYINHTSLLIHAASPVLCRNVLGETRCILWGLLTSISVVSTIYMLTLIAFCRYFLVAHPQRYALALTRRVHVILSATMWAVAAGVVVPPLAGWTAIVYNDHTHACSFIRGPSPSFKFFIVGAGFAAPLALTVFFYARLFYVVHRSRSRVLSSARLSRSGAGVDAGTAGSTRRRAAAAVADNDDVGDAYVRKTVNDPVAFTTTQDGRGPKADKVFEKSDDDDDDDEDEFVLATSIGVPAKTTTTKNQAVTTTTTTITPRVNVMTSDVAAAGTPQTPNTVVRQEKAAAAATLARQQDYVLTKIMLVIFVGFLVCFGPYSSLNLVDLDGNLAPVWLHKMAALLLYAHCCYNPVIYALTNKQFRDDYIAKWQTQRPLK